MQFFCNRSQGFLKRCIDNVSFLLFWGYSLLHNFIIFPLPTPPPHFFCIFFHSRLHRRYIHPRLNFFFQHNFVNSEIICDHHYISSLHHHHHISIVFLHRRHHHISIVTLHHHHHISIVFTTPVVFPQTGSLANLRPK